MSHDPTFPHWDSVALFTVHEIAALWSGHEPDTDPAYESDPVYWAKRKTLERAILTHSLLTEPIGDSGSEQLISRDKLTEWMIGQRPTPDFIRSSVERYFERRTAQAVVDGSKQLKAEGLLTEEEADRMMRSGLDRLYGETDRGKADVQYPLHLQSSAQTAPKDDTNPSWWDRFDGTGAVAVLDAAFLFGVDGVCFDEFKDPETAAIRAFSWFTDYLGRGYKPEDFFQAAPPGWTSESYEIAKAAVHAHEHICNAVTDGQLQLLPSSRLSCRDLACWAQQFGRVPMFLSKFIASDLKTDSIDNETHRPNGAERSLPFSNEVVAAASAAFNKFYRDLAPCEILPFLIKDIHSWIVNNQALDLKRAEAVELLIRPNWVTKPIINRTNARSGGKLSASLRQSEDAASE